MLDETIITETPPLYMAYGRRGEQKRVPITGNRSKRIIHGAINVKTGDVELLITKAWNQHTSQDFLSLVRARWRGWNIVLFEDRGAPHTADETLLFAERLGIELRFLPRATPELNAMDHLFRFVKKNTQANRPMISIDAKAMLACRYIIDMPPRERLRKAGVLSGNFWLTT